MSGGSLNYAYHKINELAEDIDLCPDRFNDDGTEKANPMPDPRRVGFQALLRLVAQAAHDIEWVDSGDCSPGYEHEAIDKVFEFIKSAK